MDDIKEINLEVKSFDIKHAVCACCHNEMLNFKLYYITYDNSYKELIPQFQIPICDKCLKRQGVEVGDNGIENKEYVEFYDKINSEMKKIRDEYVSFFRKV